MTSSMYAESAHRLRGYKLIEFYRATAFRDEDHEMDKRHGRAVLINGDVFYSPNCPRENVPPPSYSLTLGDSVTSIEHPLWWSMEYVHLAFLPRQGQKIHPLDRFLPAPTRFVRSGGQFHIDTSVILAWNKLEFELRWIIKILVGRSKIPALRSIIPSALVKSVPHRNARVLREEVKNGKGWFLYWAAQLAYVIAVNISLDKSPVRPSYDLPPEGEAAGNFDWNALFMNAIPPWFEFLGTRDWPQSLLCAIQNGIANYDVDSRIGVFLNITRPEPHQFSVDWFVKFNVPVWYPWGKNEEEAASNLSSVSRLAPLPHHLQEVATILHRSPHTPLPEEEVIVPAIQPWIVFLADRKAVNADMERREKPQERHQRLMRERNPPTANAKVFQWTKDFNDEYQRVQVPKADRTDVLSDYGKNQKVYNAFFNEWDCITELGEVDQEEFEAMNWGEESILYDPPSPRQGASSIHYPEPQENTQLHGPRQEQDAYNNSSEPASFGVGDRYVPFGLETATEPSSWLVPEHLLPVSVEAVSEIAHVLHEYFGYVPPIGGNAISIQTPSQPERLQITKAVGLNNIDRMYFDSGVGIHAVNFVRSLASNNDIPAVDLWDLAAGNRWALGSSRLLRSLRRVGSHFLFDFGDAAKRCWTLSVDQPEIVLFICRLHEDLDEAGIVKELLQRAIPHRTLILLPSHPVLMPGTVQLSVRLPDYVFTAADYRSYCNQVKNLLSDPRVVRAALMSGGITWRLAVHKGFDFVIDGPTAELIDERVGISIPTDVPGWEYWDDACTVRELDLLCGAYICYNGRKKPPFVVKSWWPLVSTWNTNVYHSWWTQHYDKLFEDRMELIKNGAAQPLSQSEWRRILRGNSLSKNLIRRTSVHSLAFLNTAVGGEFPGLRVH